MRPALHRPALVLLSAVAVCLGAAAWWLLQSEAATSHIASARPRAAPPLPLGPALVPASITAPSVAASGVAGEPTEQRVLRELEPLAVTDKARALALALEADGKLPPSGIFAEARRALIVSLLVDLQRMPEARQRAREFSRSFADSRYLPLVQGVTGIHPRPRPSQLRDARR